MIRPRYRIVIWTCKKCGMAIQTPARPSLTGCPCGGTHNWTKTTAWWTKGEHIGSSLFLIWGEDIMDYYEILEINKGASEEVIKAAYKTLVRKYHPDNYGTDNGYYQEKLKLLNEAYETLSNPDKKKIYDQNIDNLKYDNGTSNKNSINEKSQNKSENFWKEFGKGVLSYLEHQNWEIENAYYRGMKFSERELVQEFKMAKGTERLGYSRALEQKGLLERDKNNNYIPTSKFYYYS